MASLTGSRFLFFTTSPRSPLKMVPEIELLTDNFSEEKWNKKSQTEFMELLTKQDFYEGSGAKDLAFGARDRINRAPKALGFVDLKPKIKLTDAGKAFITEERKEEVLLRQLLKFQLPSPYHTESSSEENKFFVKPYLEILRLVNHFGSLTFDEVMLFGLQLVHIDLFDDVVKQIEAFRKEKARTKKSYRNYLGEERKRIILRIFEEDIKAGRTRLRESNDKSINNFVKTKSQTMRDYTDACFRYLRETGMVNIFHRGRSISIDKNKHEEIKFILENIERKPINTKNKEKYKEYLFDATIPVLYTDNHDRLVIKIQQITKKYPETYLSSLTTIQLKNILFEEIEQQKESIILNEVLKIKKYEEYDNIKNTFEDIRNNDLYDNPLMLEWNVWRGMTMLNGGDVSANLKFDDSGNPMSTAPGNKADITCDYKSFGLTVEVTMSRGQRQYEMEGEPVTRHLARYKKDKKKSAYCLFIAPEINEAVISHFFILHKLDIDYYGGKSNIFPITINTFEKMLEDSYKYHTVPTPDNVESLFKYSEKIAMSTSNESEWYEKITEKALDWLA